MVKLVLKSYGHECLGFDTVPLAFAIEIVGADLGRTGNLLSNARQ